MKLAEKINKKFKKRENSFVYKKKVELTWIWFYKNYLIMVNKMSCKQNI
jgi:hypothetical protein